MPRLLPALGAASAAAVVLAAVLVFNLGLTLGPGSSATSPSSSASPAASPTACGALPASAGTILDCSSDGSILLIQEGGENLFIRHADGSETQVTDQLSGFSAIPGSSRPTGATISPDGSRVVFAGLTRLDGKYCHNGAIFAVAATGGPATLLWTSHIPQNGIVRDPTFSPDGTELAFVDGYCDSSHGVWLMNADGSDAHQVVATDFGPLGATHVHGLAWSTTGDRLAISTDQGIYTFAPDGSDFTKADASGFCWPGLRC